jgi:hypothetical protein
MSPGGFSDIVLLMVVFWVGAAENKESFQREERESLGNIVVLCKIRRK